MHPETRGQEQSYLSICVGGREPDKQGLRLLENVKETRAQARGDEFRKQAGSMEALGSRVSA